MSTPPESCGLPVGPESRSCGFPGTSRECWPIDQSSVILSHWWYDEEMTWFSIALILSTLP